MRQIKAKLEDGESLVSSSHGSCGLHGGYLYLTTHRLVWEPLAIDIEKNRRIWPLRSIASVALFRPRLLGLIPLPSNAITLTANGGTDLLGVAQRGRWLAQINEAKRIDENR